MNSSVGALLIVVVLALGVLAWTGFRIYRGRTRGDRVTLLTYPNAAAAAGLLVMAVIAMFLMAK